MTKKQSKNFIDNLNNKSKDIQNDCIKVLYEIGERKPSLVADYAKDFVALLDHKNNRLQCGAMTAPDSLILHNSKTIYTGLTKIIAAAGKGSVSPKITQ